MPATLLPFLYQTRTLQRLPRRSLTTPLLRALYHATTPLSDASRDPPPRNQSLRGAARVAAQRASPDAIPFAFGPDQLRNQFAQEEGVLPHHEATITPLEQATFSRIFDEIASRGLKPRSIAAAPDNKEPRPPGIGASAARVEGDEEKAKLAINIVLQDAAATQNQSWRPIVQPFDPLSPVGQLASTADQNKALLRFPPSLRRAARMALGVFEADRRAAAPFPTPEPEPIQMPWEEDEDMLGLDQTQPEAKDYTTRSTLARTVEQESIRRIERRRVEQIMRDAKTDFELWDVLESHVFPMVDKLGLNDKKNADKTPAPKKAAKRGRKKAGAAAAEAAAAEAAAAEAAAVEEEPVHESGLSMRIHGPLYPYFLLSALRMLDSNFTQSSPLVHNLLPRIKELGLMSYVLGASTPFYNALANILWNRYGNAEAVFNLLEEMRHAGLYTDEGTFSVVHSISNMFNKAQSGKSGPFLQELVSLPEYEYAIRPRIKHWFTAVSIQIQEKRRDLEVSGKIPVL